MCIVVEDRCAKKPRFFLFVSEWYFRYFISNHIEVSSLKLFGQFSNQKFSLHRHFSVKRFTKGGMNEVQGGPHSLYITPTPTLNSFPGYFLFGHPTLVYLQKSFTIL